MDPRRSLDSAHGPAGRQAAIGIRVSSRCDRVSAAVVETEGAGPDAHPQILGVRTLELSGEIPAFFVRLCEGGQAVPADLVTGLTARLTEVEASLVEELLADLRISSQRILALGVYDPGFWTFRNNLPTDYLSLCDAARLAELTGINVIDAFPARDLAQGGQGGPLTALPEWMLLRDAQQDRVFLNLGRTTRMTFLPSGPFEKAVPRILSFDVGPGTQLLDLLTQRLTAGEEAFDRGGRLAVRGRRVPELLDHWRSDPYFERPLPRWHPRGVRPERFLTDSVHMAVGAGWSVRDLLCSATHFVAETVALAFQRRLPEDARLGGILLSGGGQHNGLLLREIAARVAGVPLFRVADLGLPAEAIGPASVALLALLHLEQIPANQSAVTGTEIPRVLGRLTPGSPQSWQALLKAASAARPAARSLRSAL